MKKMSPTFQFALMKTMPIMISYFFVAIAFGVMMAQQGFSWIYAAACSFFMYTGAFQFVFAGLLSGGASFFAIVMTDLFMSSRQLFYGISHIDDYKKTGKMMPYMMHTLTDETYALLNAIPIYPENVDQSKAEIYIQMLSHFSWLGGTIVGALIGNLIPSSIEGFDFAITALFITIVLDQWRSEKSHTPTFIGFGCALLFLLWFGPSNFILFALISASILLVITDGRGKEETIDE